MQDVSALSNQLEVDQNRWIFAGGKQEEVLKLGNEMGLAAFQDKQAGGPPFTAPQIALVDKGGRVRKLYVGLDLGNTSQNHRRPHIVDFFGISRGKETNG